MRFSFLPVLAALGFLGASGAAVEAMPIATVASSVDDSRVILTSGGCGPYGHRGFYGHCRSNGFYGRPVFAPRRFYGGPYYHRRFGYRHFY